MTNSFFVYFLPHLISLNNKYISNIQNLGIVLLISFFSDVNKTTMERKKKK
jgi:hypothetical protein